MAEICKDLAQSLTTKDGRVACEAQDEVLQVCDQLYINSKITENQLLYLRHLVLIREESVAGIYDEFQEHQSVPMLAKSLYDLSNTHPYQQASVQSPELVNTYAEGHPNRDRLQPNKKEESSATEILSGVVALMIRSRTITNGEADVLLEMVKLNNVYVLGAYDLFINDNNLEELQDTLMRCGKLEIRKRLAADNDGFKNQPLLRQAYDERQEQDVMGDISLDSILQNLKICNYISRIL